VALIDAPYVGSLDVTVASKQIIGAAVVVVGGSVVVLQAEQTVGLYNTDGVDVLVQALTLIPSET
jgi:hypothetical protein